MKNKGTRLVAIAAAVSMGLEGCTMVPESQPMSVAPAYQTEGSVVPVYNPPPNTPFHCVGTPAAITLFGIPGDPLGYPRLGITTAPVATMGNRRGDWLSVVTHTGEIGWLDDPIISTCTAPTKTSACPWCITSRRACLLADGYSHPRL